MKIGVISDTHDRLPTLRRALALFERLQVGAVIHAGDIVSPFAARLLAEIDLEIPLYCVFGNNDGDHPAITDILPNIQDGPLQIELDGRTMAVHHDLPGLPAGAIKTADVIITGHTHVASVSREDGKLYVNPGECCGWVNDRPTIALLDLEQLSAEIVEVHE